MKRAPRTVGDVLDRSLGWVKTPTGSLKGALHESELFTQWEELVGKEVAAAATPDRILKGGILVLRVEDAAWIQELQLRVPEILEKLRTFREGARISQIRMKTGKPRNGK